MAERRMVSCGFLTSDAFLHLPLQARSLYIALLTAADDDGFVDNPEAVRKSWGLRKPALSQLLEAGLLLDFDGVVLLTHWLQHNRIPRDRYRPTRHTALLSQVLLGDAREYIRWRRDPAPAASDPEADAAAPLDADADALDALDAGALAAFDSLDVLDAPDAPPALDSLDVLDALDAPPALAADALDALDAEADAEASDPAATLPASDVDPEAAAQVAAALTEVLPEARAAWLRWELRRCRLRIFDGRAGPGDPARYRALSAALAQEE